MIREIINNIQGVIASYNELVDHTKFDAIETLIVDHYDAIKKENVQVADMMIEIQDLISEMSYMEDNSNIISEIKEIADKIATMI